MANIRPYTERPKSSEKDAKLRDCQQLAALERPATRVGPTETQATPIAVTDIVQVRKSIYPVTAGERGIAVALIGLKSRPCWNVLFKNGETAVVLAANLIRVAPSLGD